MDLASRERLQKTVLEGRKSRKPEPWRILLIIIAWPVLMFLVPQACGWVFGPQGWIQGAYRKGHLEAAEGLHARQLSKLDGALEFRHLFNGAALGADGGKGIGDFDGDGQQELAIMGQAPGGPFGYFSFFSPQFVAPGAQISANGAVSNTDLREYFFVSSMAVWDADEDGRDDIVPGQTMDRFYDYAVVKPRNYYAVGDPWNYTPLLASSGELKGHTAGFLLMNTQQTGDFDGDGHIDLMTREFPNYGTFRTIFHGSRGRELGHYDSRREIGICGETVADTDGDGRDEAICIPYESGKIISISYDRPHKVIGKWPQADTITMKSVDINGDGRDELINATGFFNPATGKLVPLQYPPDAAARTGGVDEVAIGDFDGNGKPEIACALYCDRKKVEVYVFREDGSLSKRKELSGWLNFLGTLRDHNADYLVLVRGLSSVSIYP